MQQLKKNIYDFGQYFRRAWKFLNSTGFLKYGGNDPFLDCDITANEFGRITNDAAEFFYMENCYPFLRDALCIKNALDQYKSSMLVDDLECFYMCISSCVLPFQANILLIFLRRACCEVEEESVKILSKFGLNSEKTKENEYQF